MGSAAARPYHPGMEVLRQPPLRFLRSAWPWRSLAYLASGAVVGVAVLCGLLLLAALGVLLTPVLVGLVLLAAFCLAGLPVAALERRRVALIRVTVPGSPHGAPPDLGPLSWLRTRLAEAATWRELGFAVLVGLVLWPVELAVVAVAVLPTLLALFGPLIMIIGPEAWTPAGRALGGWIWLTPPMGVVLAIAAAYGLTLAASARAALTRTVLPGSLDAASRLVEVRRSRARLIDGFETERRRIERDRTTAPSSECSRCRSGSVCYGYGSRASRSRPTR